MDSLFEHTPPVPPGNLTPGQLFSALVEDFTAVWDALVQRPHDEVRPGIAGANFLLLKTAVTLLELSSRVASRPGPDNAVHRHFSDQLGYEDKRYYLELPCDVPPPRGFQLPHSRHVPRHRQLLALLFDLVRHGQAHYYQQIPARLSDGSIFGFSAYGAEPGRPTLANCRSSPQWRAGHLELRRSGPRLWMAIRPDILFTDVEVAARRASLFSGTLSFDYFERDLATTRAELESALRP